MIFRGVGGALIGGLLCLYLSFLPGPWMATNEALQVIPTWIIRWFVRLAGIFMLYGVARWCWRYL